MIAIAALLVSISVFIFIPTRAEPRLLRLVDKPNKRRAQITPRQFAFAATVLVAIACVIIFGVFPGAPLAVIGVVLVPRLTTRLESGEARRYRQQLERQFPGSLDVLISILESGAPPAEALRAVGQALGPPIGTEFDRVARALGLGASTDQAWAAADPVVRPLARAMSRSAQSGAPLAHVLAGASSDARREHRVIVEVAARSAGVRAVAPLAACFLPAFFLVGVAPIIASFVDQVVHS